MSKTQESPKKKLIMIELIRYCTITDSTVNDFDYGQDEEPPDCVALKLSFAA
jgi:hypothetical protein